MIGRGKAKHARSKELSQRSKEDSNNRISQLPDHLICQILSLLSTKDAVKTSVLSIRWRHVWLWLPSLELNSRKFSDINAFVSFGGRVFDSSRVTCMQKLTLTLGRDASIGDDSSYLTSWIDAAIKRKIQHLDVDGAQGVCFTMDRLRLHSCETLIYLRLFNVLLDDDTFVVLPCLKTMYLEKNQYPSETTLKKLITSCPVLENLKLVSSSIDSKVYRVHSRSLKMLNIERHTLSFDGSPGVVNDAPLLRSLSIDDHESKSFVVNSLETNAKLNISFNFGLSKTGVIAKVSSRRSSIRDFVTGISRVGDMTICPRTFKVICLYMVLERLPQFEYMSRLCISLHATCSIWLITFLRSFPNLKSLVLGLFIHRYYELNRPSVEENQMFFSSVPKCFLSSLEFVDFQFRGLGMDMKLVCYFLENSAMLKKLTLRLDSHSRKDEILKELLKVPRSSTKCEVVIL